MTYVPGAFFLRDIPILKGKSVVCETWDCPGYAMYYFLGKGGFTVSIPDIHPTSSRNGRVLGMGVTWRQFLY